MLGLGAPGHRMEFMKRSAQDTDSPPGVGGSGRSVPNHVFVAMCGNWSSHMNSSFPNAWGLGVNT